MYLSNTQGKKLQETQIRGGKTTNQITQKYKTTFNLNHTTIKGYKETRYI